MRQLFTDINEHLFDSYFANIGLEMKPCPIQDNLSQGTTSANLSLHM
jgi:hypothetical protein